MLTTLDGTSIYEFANNFTLNIRNSRNKQQLLSSYTCLTQKSTDHQFNTINQYNTIDKQLPSNHYHPKTSAWSIRPHSSSSLNNLNGINNQQLNSNIQTRMSLGHVINNSFNSSTNYLEYIIHSTKEW